MYLATNMKDKQEKFEEVEEDDDDGNGDNGDNDQEDNVPLISKHTQKRICEEWVSTCKEPCLFRMFRHERRCGGVSMLMQATSSCRPIRPINRTLF